jgi:probable rRNA maturation factor
MNVVSIHTVSVTTPPSIEAFILAALEFLKKDKWELSLLFCDDAYIRDLNKRFRDKDEATDVLSFSLGEQDGERYLPGDIVISLETLRENAAYFGISEDEEVRRLVIHGILHLDGMDHATNEADEPMLQLQERILKEVERLEKGGER